MCCDYVCITAVNLSRKNDRSVRGWIIDWPSRGSAMNWARKDSSSRIRRRIVWGISHYRDLGVLLDSCKPWKTRFYVLIKNVYRGGKIKVRVFWGGILFNTGFLFSFPSITAKKTLVLDPGTLNCFLNSWAFPFPSFPKTSVHCST